MKKVYFYLGLSAGLFWGAVLICLIVPLLANTATTLEKASAIYECKDHYGVYKISSMGYIICNDNHRPKYLTTPSNEVYMLLKEIESKTYFGVTFMDWKNYKSNLNK